VFTTMPLGRWSSYAFLRHIGKQVEEFGADTASEELRRGASTMFPTQMLTIREHVETRFQWPRIRKPKLSMAANFLRCIRKPMM
jgi:hypothetical protein